MSNKFQFPAVLSAPCKDCKDRTLYCHKDCERYLKFKENSERLKQIRQREFRYPNDLDNYDLGLFIIPKSKSRRYR